MGSPEALLGRGIGSVVVRPQRRILMRPRRPPYLGAAGRTPTCISSSSPNRTSRAIARGSSVSSASGREMEIQWAL